jgi:hypothetical protein
MNLNNLNDKSAQVLLLVFITVLLFGSLTPGSRSASTTQSTLVSTSAQSRRSKPYQAQPPPPPAQPCRYLPSTRRRRFGVGWPWARWSTSTSVCPR